MKKLIFTVLILLLTSGVHAASFDCTKASTFVEKAICSDTELSKLDDLLMNSYKKTLTNVSNTEKLKSGQRAWLSNTRNKCPDNECIKDAYSKRIADINGIAASRNPVSDKVIKNAGSLWAGEWNRIDHSKHEEADMTITKNTSQGFEFSLIAFSGGNSGQLDGTASFVANFASYQDSELGCIVEFRMKNKCIAITTEDCSGIAGLGVYFDGTYCKGKQKKKQTSNVFMDMGIFSNDSELKAFKELVGKTYGLFEDRFQLVNEEEDLDQLNLK